MATHETGDGPSVQHTTPRDAGLPSSLAPQKCDPVEMYNNQNEIPFADTIALTKDTAQVAKTGSACVIGEILGEILSPKNKKNKKSTQLRWRNFHHETDNGTPEEKPRNGGLQITIGRHAAIMLGIFVMLVATFGQGDPEPLRPEPTHAPEEPVITHEVHRHLPIHFPETNHPVFDALTRKLIRKVPSMLVYLWQIKYGGSAGPAPIEVD